MNRLTIAYDLDHSADDGLFRASVEASNFSGSGSFWVQAVVVEEFARALGKFPISVDEPPTIVMGYNNGKGDDLVIGLTLDASDPRGALVMSAEIADRFHRTRRVKTTFVTHYPDVERFARQLLRVAVGECQEAVLEGS